MLIDTLIDTTPHAADVPLRDLQRINAAFSGFAGLTIAVSSGWLSQQVDLPRSLVAALGVGLVGWSVLLVVLAVQPAERLVQASALVAAGDTVWVIGTLALLVLRDPTATGTTLAISAAAVVGAFAVAGVVLRRRTLRRVTAHGPEATR